MADVTRVARPTDRDGRGDHPGTSGGGLVPPPAPIDARAVRVSLAPASRLGDEPVMLVGPVAPPLRMTNPTVGVGPLGGVVLPDGDPAGAGGDGPADGELPGGEGHLGVLAQRQVLVDGEPSAAGLAGAGHGRYRLDGPDGPTRLVLEPAEASPGGRSRREVLVDGFRFEVDVEPERIAALRERASRGRATSAHAGPLEVHAIIPGKVVSVSIAAGDAVTAGQQLLVVEAMKMQNELRAPRDGTIARVGVAPGVNIEVGDLLVVIS